MKLEAPVTLTPYADTEKRKAVQARYNASEKGMARRGQYRHDTGKYSTTASYLAKPFIAVDGEAVTNDDGTQTYLYLALSTGESIRDDNGISTLDILRFLAAKLPESKKGIAVIYGGGFDWNHWVADLSRGQLESIYNGSYRESAVEVGAFKLRWQVGKSFTIKTATKLVTINDVSSFFQSSFLDACDEWLGEYEGREQIAAGKKIRDRFDIADMPTIIEYNRLELARLVDLCEVLRERLDRVNIRPRRWTGPGNGVATLFRRFKIKEHMDKAIPDPVAEASRFAYAGGRIEMVRYGYVNNRCSYQYDLNGAYNEAVAELPSLAGGKWVYRKGDPGDYPFALYKVSVHARNAFHPSPIFSRGSLGSISYPLHAHNWVWSPDMVAVREWARRLGGKYTVVEAYVFEPATVEKPFGWIRALYKERQELKAAGDPAQLALKTILAAVYGKLAQQLGYLEAKGRRLAEVPPYHQLEWAGYVTAFVRAKVFLAALENPSAVIAFETDALFMAEPLENVTIGTGLGEWKVTEYSELAYVQSGIYSGILQDGSNVVKVRGFSADWVTRDSILDALSRPENDRVVRAYESRFIGLGIALQVPEMKYWRQWVEQERILKCRPMGKRIHYLCGCESADMDGLLPNFWHQTICPSKEQISKEYPVLWINPDPELERLSELRKSISEWD